MKLHTVLRPPENVSHAAIGFAQKHFSQNHMGYCIGSDGHLPHITLIQTEVPDETVAKNLFNAIGSLSWNVDNDLVRGNYYHNNDKPYCGVEIINNDVLQSCHEQALTIHRELDIPVFNDSGDSFWPHMTFAKSEKRLSEPVNLPAILEVKSNGWRLEFGHTGDHGVYLRSFSLK